MQSYPVATIDLAALKHNLSKVKSLAPNSNIMSVIKANAYGHGDIEVAEALQASDAFAVARLSEGLRLRQAGISKPIVILEGVHSAEDLIAASEHHLSLVFHNQQQITFVEDSDLARPLTFCWLMLESGMHRLGLNKHDFMQSYTKLSNCSGIAGPIGLMSHFANADTIDDQRNQQQLMMVQSVADIIEGPISLANSAAILSMPTSHYDWLRPGLMLYGISPFENQSAADLGLKPVMKVSAQLISIQQLHKGDQVGYGGDWQATQAMTAGTVNIGYGDGYNRQLSGKGEVRIQGQKAKVLGRVSMDMICIDLSDITDVKIGDEVVLCGADGLLVEQLAQQANTIGYELVTQLNQRVKRQYHG